MVDTAEGVTIDWKDESAITCLTQAIMIVAFGLKTYDLPSNYLVPRIPQRLAYLSWIKNLFDISDERIENGGFDIGVGANCIYPILGTLNFNWKMTGSEINLNSIKWADERIIQSNPLLVDKITIRLQANSNCILDNVI